MNQGSNLSEAPETNVAGRPYLRPCQHCRQDFGSKQLWRRHRLQRSERYYQREEHCLSPDEMMAKGWYLDAFGRWRDSRGRKT